MPKSAPATFQLRDVFTITIWGDQSFFKTESPADGAKYVRANYIVDVLSSVNYYCGSKNKMLSQIAQVMVEQFEKEIDEVIAHYSEQVEIIRSQGADDVAAQFILPAPEAFAFEIPGNRVCPIVFRFLRALLTFDAAMVELSALRQRGLLHKSEYQVRKRDLAKSLRRLMHDVSARAKRFHAQRKTMQDQGRATTVAANG